MTTKEDLISAMQQHVDGSGDENLRSAFGEPNHRVLIDGEVEDTGQSWTPPNFIDSLLHAVGAVLDGLGMLRASIANQFDEVNNIPEKLTIDPYDRILIEDSADGYKKKWIKADLLIYTPPPTPEIKQSRSKNMQKYFDIYGLLMVSS